MTVPRSSRREDPEIQLMAKAFPAQDKVELSKRIE